MNTTQPLHDRFGNVIPDWYTGYVKAASGYEFLTLLKENLIKTTALLKSIPIEKENYAYAEGKWTLKEVVLHVIDTERIFAYRSLRFARNDKTDLSGFDENKYAPESNASKRSMISIINEYEAVRLASIELFESFNDEVLARTGTANKNLFSVELMGIILAGHEQHHIKILKERYL